MKTKTAGFAVILAGAAAIAFIAGRRTAAPALGSVEERGHEHEGREEWLSLSLEAQRKFGVQFAKVEDRSFGETIRATGSVQPNASRLAHIRALARGRIDGVYVRLGDRVKAGQRLLTYDNVELGDAIGEYLSALAELQKAEAEAEVSARSLERARNLVNLGAVARAELQRREAEHKTGLATIESRKAGAAKVEEKLHRFGMSDEEIRKLDPRNDMEYHRERSHTTVTSPLDGIVTQFNVAPGEAVNTEDELMTVADLSTVWVQADVYEKDIHAVRQGRQASVAAASYPGRVFSGVVSYVSDVLDPATRTAKVRIEVPNFENLLKVEMFTTVEIPTPATGRMLSVPAVAVQNVDGSTVAFVKADERRFEMRPLSAGRRSGEWIEVLEGLRAGEVVVTEGSFLLKSEAKKSELGEHEE